MAGLFISFEGIDRCGKATQITLLSEYLTQAGVAHTVGREPGGTNYGEAARRLAQDPHIIEKLNKVYPEAPLPLSHDLNAEGELFAYLLARSMFAEHVVLPILQRGEIFIADRCGDSSVAYQGHGHHPGDEEKIGFIKLANRHALRGLEIHRTYLLDLPAEESDRRRGDWEFGGEKDRIEMREVEYFARVRRGYLQLAEEEPQRFRVLDATLPRTRLHALIKQDIQALLKQHGLLSKSLVGEFD